MILGIISVSFVSAGAVNVVNHYDIATTGDRYFNLSLNVGESVTITFKERTAYGDLKYTDYLGGYYDESVLSVTYKTDESLWWRTPREPRTYTITAVGAGESMAPIRVKCWNSDKDKDYDYQLYINVTVKGSSASVVNKAKPSLTVANKGNALRAQWSAISGASSYAFYYRSASASSWSSTTVSGTSYNFQGTPGTMYYFQVIPKFGSTNGTPSNVVSCTYVRNTTLRRTAYNSNGTVTVGWDSAPGANGYAVAKKRSTDKSYTYYYVSGTSFTDRNVVGGALYYYQIRPYYSNGKSAAYSDWSNTKTITTLFRPTITNMNSTTSRLNINWNAIKGAKGYRVAFKRSYDSAWNYRTTTSRYYNVPNPTKGATYYVQVCAISGNLAGAYSAVNSIKI